ncbi:hypothetical protein GUJ93_ZPchr0138g26 [Zizania palustris]|uniref:Uncharacterized protein n=1 Tax=Zizania palustris TaxID=103762 RepID=A0A8J5UVA4_ZIZPA|nr:hypothetical protein GUJ93_ZPchr0138g26 [Zizania palustris]
MIFANLVGGCFAPSPTGTEWGTQALQCLPPDPLTRKSYSKVFWLTVRTPLHPGSRPPPRKLWSVKSGIRIPLQSLLRRFPLQCLERQRKQNRTPLLLIGRDDLSLFERKVLYKRPAPVTPRFWTHCVILLCRMGRSSVKKEDYRTMLDFMLSRLQSDVNPRALKELLNRLQNGRARSQTSRAARRFLDED